MGKPMLILRLDGALQSWGSPARWTVRGSQKYPTKSAVIGLLACAMGESRDSEMMRKLDKHLRMGCRNDLSGSELVDYHTVTGMIMNAEGKFLGNKGKGTTILTNRSYLQDAIYTVILGAVDETGVMLLELCREGLENPEWVTFLGRKCCVPSRPLFECFSEVFASIRQALENIPLEQQQDTDRGILPANGSCLCIEEHAEGHLEVQDGSAIGTARSFSPHQYLEYAVPLGDFMRVEQERHAVQRTL